MILHGLNNGCGIDVTCMCDGGVIDVIWRAVEKSESFPRRTLSILIIVNFSFGSSPEDRASHSS